MKKIDNNTGVSIKGLIIILIGSLFLLNNFDIIPNFIDNIFISWKTVIIAIGLIMLFGTKDKTRGIILIAIGILFSFPFILKSIFLSIILGPVILIAIGVYIIYRNSTNRTSI